MFNWAISDPTSCWNFSTLFSAYILSREKRPKSSNIISSVSLRSESSLQAFARWRKWVDGLTDAITCDRVGLSAPFGGYFVRLYQALAGSLLASGFRSENSTLLGLRRRFRRDDAGSRQRDSDFFSSFSVSEVFIAIGEGKRAHAMRRQYANAPEVSKSRASREAAYCFLFKIPSYTERRPVQSVISGLVIRIDSRGCAIHLDSASYYML